MSCVKKIYISTCVEIAGKAKCRETIKCKHKSFSQQISGSFVQYMLELSHSKSPPRIIYAT